MLVSYTETVPEMDDVKTRAIISGIFLYVLNRINPEKISFCKGSILQRIFPAKYKFLQRINPAKKKSMKR